MRQRLVIAATLCVLLGAPVRVVSEAEMPRFSWRSLPAGPGAGAPVRALALAPGGGRLALGSERGGLVLAPGGGPSVALRQPDIRALAFRDGVLLVGTGDGLFEAASDGGLRAISLGAGALLREVRDLDAVGSAGAGGIVAAVATAGGLQLRAASGEWSRAPLPAGAVEHVRFLGGPDARRLAAWGPGGLWLLRLDDPPRAARQRLPRLAEGALPASLARTPEASLLVVYPDALARERADGSFEVFRPSLPPGAALRRYAHAFGRHWLASDAGLLVAEALAGPWRRAPGLLASRAVVTLVGEADALFVATEREVYAALAVAEAPLPPLPALRPTVQQVQRAALRHQALQADHPAALWRGLTLRGWLPELSVAGSYERSRSSGGDYDQSVVSGVTRLLHDRDYDRDRELQVGVTLRWDLGDLAYHPESIDVSREARALVALRDDVLDEVNQLYFERLRVLAQLGALPPGVAEAHALEARVAELAAGLDAWTGGWFGRAVHDFLSGPETPRRKSK